MSFSYSYGLAWYQGLLPALLPTFFTILVTFIGFFIFHKLALARQKRQEVFDRLKNIRACIESVVVAAETAWKKTGIDAALSGDVYLLRGKILRTSIEIEQLIKSAYQFNDGRVFLRTLRQSCDEYYDGNVVHNILDQARSTKAEACVDVYRAAADLNVCLDGVFSSIYK